MSNLFTHQFLECDVLVIGGGPAGVPAAIAAARAGSRVILCHDRPVLGGNASSEVRMHIVGANAGWDESKDWRQEARETGIVEEIRLTSQVQNTQRSASMFDLILLDLCRAEKNLALYLNTSVHEVTMKDRRITEAIARRPSTEEIFTIRAKVFIDCTGDGSVGAAAGAGFTQGRESQADYQEPKAQVQADSKTLGSTLLFTAKEYDRPMPFKAPSWARKFREEDFRHREFRYPTFEYGYWWLEWGGQLNTIKNNEAIRDELLAILLGVWDYIKNGGDPRSKNWALDWFGFLPGKRESRRFHGQYRLTENDLYASGRFPDAIAYGGWPIDTHPPEGVDAPDEPPCVQTLLPYIYDIPLRSCVSADLENLMFAGRNISATHIAFASTRVMATCALVGEGVGVAAAYAVEHGLEPSALSASKEAVHAIQQRLLREDNFLIGLTEDGKGNHACCAAITASSELPEGPASAVVSGQNRSVDGMLPGDRQIVGSHRWMSDPAAGLPAWLELRWQEPISFSQIGITFDTGLHRYMTHTHYDAYHRQMISGPQPETVKVFSIEVETASGWEVIDQRTENWERRYRYNGEAVNDARAVRITVEQTHGLDHARIVRVGIY